jgi:hypothetical protein
MAVKKTTDRTFGNIGDDIIMRDGMILKKIKNVNGINNIGEFLEALQNGGVHYFEEDVPRIMNVDEKGELIGIIVSGIPINLWGERREGEYEVKIQENGTTELSFFVGLEGVQRIKEDWKGFFDEIGKGLEELHITAVKEAFYG